jgi:hypothetical protein
VCGFDATGLGDASLFEASAQNALSTRIASVNAALSPEFVFPNLVPNGGGYTNTTISSETTICFNFQLNAIQSQDAADVANSIITTPLQVQARFFSPGAGEPVFESCGGGSYEYTLAPPPPAPAGSTSEQTARDTSKTMTVGLTVACAAILVIVAGLVAVRRRQPGSIDGAEVDSTGPAADHYYPPQNDLFDEAPYVPVSMSPAAAKGGRQQASPNVIADDYQGSHYFPWHARDESNVLAP